MITCPFCKTIHVENTLFCDECGTYLLEEGRRDTFPLEEENQVSYEHDFSKGTPSSPKDTFPKTFAQILPPPILRLKVGPHQKEFEAVLDKTIHLGRLDPKANVFPEIDLTDENGIENGISRKHVRLLYRQGKVMVEDLGSINGTTLNSRKLSAYLPEELADGDMLVLGKLSVEITIISQEPNHF